MKKILSVLLAFALIVGTFVPSATFANETKTVNDLKNEIEGIKENVNEDYQKHLDDLVKSAEKLEEVETAKDQPAMRAAGAAAIGAQMLAKFIATLPERIELSLMITKAIRFATTTLADRVVEAHNEIGFAIASALAATVNPMTDSRQLVAKAQELQKLMNHLAQHAPVLGPESVATIYVKAKLDDILHKARFLKYNKAKYKPVEAQQVLDKAVLSATGKRLLPNIKVREINQLIEEINFQMEILLSEEDALATWTELVGMDRKLSQARMASYKKPWGEGSKIRQQVAKLTFNVRLKWKVTSKEVADAMAQLDEMLK